MASIRRRNGKYQVQVRQGNYSKARSFTLLSDAKEWARNQELEAAGRLYLGRQYQPKNFAEILSRYAEEITPAKRSAKNEMIVIKALQRESWTKVDLSHLRTEDLIKFRDKRLKDVKPATLKRQLNIIKHACIVAERDWDWSSPLTIFKKLTLPKSPVHIVRRITPKQQAAIVNAAKGCRSPYMAPLVLFALETAMRRGELLNLTWEDIELSNSELLIRQTKNGHQRLLPLSPKAVRILENLPRHNSGRVFPLSAGAVRQSFTRLRLRAELPNIRFHDLRHEAISRLFDDGLTVIEIAQLSGHRFIPQSLKYGHASEALIREKLYRGDQSNNNDPIPCLVGSFSKAFTRHKISSR